MSIAWLDHPQYWKIRKGEKSYFDEVAVLSNVCWLDVRLEYKGAPRGRYSVTWRLKTDHISDVTFCTRFGTTTHETQMDFTISTDWISIEGEKEIIVDKTGGEIFVGFYQHGGQWKSGLVIDYVEVKWVGDI